MFTFKNFENEFNNLSNNEQVEIFNKFCDKYNLTQQFYEMSSLDDFLMSSTHLGVLNSLEEGFDKDKDYIQQNGYGNYESLSGIEVRLYISESGYMSEIYEDESLWCDTIDTTPYEEEDEDEEDED